MRTGIAIAAIFAAVVVSSPGFAQYNPNYEQSILKQRAAPSNGIYASDWHDFQKYDYDRPARGESAYFADHYYRDSRYYQPRKLDRNDRIYRGSNRGYYCRRPDGTTGRVDVLGNGSLGNILATGESERLGAIAAATSGAKLGQSIDRQQVICR